MFKYFAFGLKIISDLDLPELIESQFEEYDLEITLGDIPHVIWDNNSLHNPILSIDKCNLLLKLPPATYLASNGSRIFIAPNPGQDFDSIRLFLYSNIFAAIMHQRNYLLIHASGVVYKEKLHLFLGASGMGKSTIVAFLENKGYEIYSDDVILFKLTDGELITCQTYPQIRLWEDTFDKLGIKKITAKKIRPELPKFGIKINKYVKGGSYQLGKLFFLANSSDSEKFQISNLNSIETFKLLNLNIYRELQVSKKLDPNYIFKILIEISKNQSFLIERHVDFNTIEEQMEIIQTKFKNE